MEILEIMFVDEEVEDRVDVVERGVSLMMRRDWDGEVEGGRLVFYSEIG